MKCFNETCSNEIAKYNTKYCSNKCQAEHKWQKLRVIVADNKIDTLGRSVEYASSIGKRFLIERNGPQCSACGWQTINKFTNKVPIEIDHIDGDCENNHLNNLRLLCPNCHSLTATFKGANKGSKSKRYANAKARLLQC